MPVSKHQLAPEVQQHAKQHIVVGAFGTKKKDDEFRRLLESYGLTYG